MYLVQGFFVQQRAGLTLGFGFDPEIQDSGPHVMVRSVIMPYMFAGAFWKSKGVVDEWRGAMADVVGESQITDIWIDTTTMRFAKTYEKYRDQPNPSISYTFEKDVATNTWAGRWVFQKHPDLFGTARCILTEVDEALFQSDIEAFSRHLAKKE